METDGAVAAAVAVNGPGTRLIILAARLTMLVVARAAHATTLP
jgi:hypothetical protein